MKISSKEQIWNIVNGVDKGVTEFIWQGLGYTRQKRLGTTALKAEGRGVGIPSDPVSPHKHRHPTPSYPQPAPKPPECLAFTQSLMGLVGD